MENNSLIIKGQLSTDTVLEAVTKVTGVSKKNILSGLRYWPVVEARMLSALMLSRLGLVDIKIAWILNRGRASICKSRHVGEDLLQVSKTFQDKFNKVQSILNPQKDEK